MDNMKHRRLQELDRSDFEVVDGQPDIRGWDGRNTDGKKIGEVEQELGIPFQTMSVEYNEEQNSIAMLFNCYCSIKLPKYDKWYEKNLGERNTYSYPLNHLRCSVPLVFDDFAGDDFYVPGKAVQFKKAVAGALRSSNGEGEQVYAEWDVFVRELEGTVEKMDESSSIEVLLSQIEHPLAPPFKNLYVYLGQKEKAIELYRESHEKYISHLSQSSHISQF